jgi:hypothetical protein
MTNLLITPASLVNTALDRVGYKKRIGSLYDGSDAALKALDIYGQCRDQLLRDFEWGFAERDVTLSLLKTAPVGGYSASQPWNTTYPILPWIYEYTYPADMIKLRSLRAAGPIPDYDPGPVVFRVANDNSYNPFRRVILTNLTNAIAVYTGQVTDPSTWDVGFTESFITQLGQRLAPALVELEAIKILAPQAAVETETAETQVG